MAYNYLFSQKDWCDSCSDQFQPKNGLSHPLHHCRTLQGFDTNINTNTLCKYKCKYKYTNSIIQIQRLGSLNTAQGTLPSLAFCQGIIFDYSLGEAVGDVLQELLGFDPNFSFFHVTFTTSIHRQNLHHLHQVGGPDPLSPSNLPVANSQSLDLAAADASDAPVPR